MADPFSLLPQMNIPQDPGILSALAGGYGLGQKMRSDVVNQEAGAQAAAGDWNGAAQTALRSGNIDLGTKLQQLPVDRQVQFYDLLGRTAQAATTPEQWAQMSSKMTQLFGPESMRGYETVDARQRAIDLATSAKEKALLKVEQQKAAASTLQAQAAMAGVDVQREGLNKPQMIQDKDGGLHIFDPGKAKGADPLLGVSTYREPNPENKFNSALNTATGTDLGKSRVEDYTKTIEAGNKAGDANVQLEALSAANQRAKSGALADTRMKLGQFVSLFGGDPSMLTGNQASMELMNSLSVLGSLDLSQLSKGSISNFEGQQFARAVAGKENTREGNQMLIDFAKMANDRRIAMKEGYLKIGAGANEQQREAIRQQAFAAVPMPPSISGEAPPQAKGRRGAAATGQAPAQASGPVGTSTNPYQPASAAEFNRLPIGSYVMNPADGKVSQKTANIAEPVPAQAQPRSFAAPGIKPKGEPLAPHNLLRQFFGYEATK